MSTVKGRYNGNVVVLNEPAPVSHEVEVEVRFPEDEEVQGPERSGSRKWHWEESRARIDSLQGTVSEELERQRGMD